MEDRDQIFSYIAGDSPRAAARVDNLIEAQVAQLIDFPESGRLGRILGTRELVLQRTPYIAAYLITDRTVRILRILHGTQEWLDAMLP